MPVPVTAGVKAEGLIPCILLPPDVAPQVGPEGVRKVLGHKVNDRRPERESGQPSPAENSGQRKRRPPLEHEGLILIAELLCILIAELSCCRGDLICEARSVELEVVVLESGHDRRSVQEGHPAPWPAAAAYRVRVALSRPPTVSFALLDARFLSLASSGGGKF